MVPQGTVGEADSSHGHGVHMAFDMPVEDGPPGWKSGKQDDGVYRMSE